MYSEEGNQALDDAIMALETNLRVLPVPEAVFDFEKRIKAVGNVHPEIMDSEPRWAIRYAKWHALSDALGMSYNPKDDWADDEEIDGVWQKMLARQKSQGSERAKLVQPLIALISDAQALLTRSMLSESLDTDEAVQILHRLVRLVPPQPISVVDFAVAHGAVKEELTGEMIRELADKLRDNGMPVIMPRPAKEDDSDE